MAAISRRPTGLERIPGPLSQGAIRTQRVCGHGGSLGVPGSTWRILGAYQARLGKLPRMPRKPPATTETSPVAEFETSMNALEDLVARMEDGEMSLEDSLAAYERGVGLYRSCQQALEQAELRVRLLSDPANPDQAQPFDTSDDA